LNARKVQSQEMGGKKKKGKAVLNRMDAGVTTGIGNFSVEGEINHKVSSSPRGGGRRWNSRAVGKAESSAQKESAL